MLVLSRKLNDRIIIDNCIYVSPVKFSPGKVRLAIEAPDHISIHREEVYQSILIDQRLAGLSPFALEPMAGRPGPTFLDRLRTLAREAHNNGDHNAYLTLASLADITEQREAV